MKFKVGQEVVITGNGDLSTNKDIHHSLQLGDEGKIDDMIENHPSFGNIYHIKVVDKWSWWVSENHLRLPILAFWEANCEV